MLVARMKSDPQVGVTLFCVELHEIGVREKNVQINNFPGTVFSVLFLHV
jgi:hypothetical protein